METGEWLKQFSNKPKNEIQTKSLNYDKIYRTYTY